MDFNLLKKFILFVVFSLMWSCGSSTENTKVQTPESNICTVIFIDKSISVDANQAFVNEKYQRILKEAINQNIRHQGDRIEIYYIHENTAKGKAFQGVSRSEMEDLTNVSATDAEATKTAFELSLQKEKLKFVQVAFQKLAVANTSSSNQGTDIQAALPIIDHLASQGFEVKAYFFSDMIESMKGVGRRDFHISPPKDQSTAEALAKADAKALIDRLGNIGTAEIKLVLPFEPTSTIKQNNPVVTSYWQILFAELGITSVEELF
jgi:hypothetical protein